MRRSRTLMGSTRQSDVERPATAVWTTAVAAGRGPHWYTDALPLRFRQGLDRIAGGTPGVDAPEREVLLAGDRAGLWEVLDADDARRRLTLEARVRAPGTVRLQLDVGPAPERPETRSRLDLAITFAPRGPLGLAYLMADLPARGVMIEWVMLHLLAEVRRA